MIRARQLVALGSSVLCLAAAAFLAAACDGDGSSANGSGSFDFDAQGLDGATASNDGAVAADGASPDAGGAIPGRSLRFDYATAPELVTLPDGPLLDLKSALTYELWIKPASSSDIETVISKASGSGHGDTTAIWFEDGQLHAGINAESVNETVITTAWPATNNGAWHHLAFSYEDATGAEVLYIDGVVVAMLTNSNGTPAYDPTHPFTIGSDFDSGSFGLGFSGGIDDVRIFSSARTAAQIASDMTGASPLGEPDLVAYLPFNEGAGTTTADLSPNHLVGSLGTSGDTTNLPTWSADGAPK